MTKEKFENDFPIAAKILDKYKNDLPIYDFSLIRKMLTELSLECEIQFRGESSVEIKELTERIKTLESTNKTITALNDYYKKGEHEYTATELAAKLQVLGYFGSIEKRGDIWNDNIIVGKETHRIEI